MFVVMWSQCDEVLATQTIRIKCFEDLDEAEDFAKSIRNSKGVEWVLIFKSIMVFSQLEDEEVG